MPPASDQRAIRVPAVSAGQPPACAHARVEHERRHRDGQALKQRVMGLRVCEGSGGDSCGLLHAPTVVFPDRVQLGPLARRDAITTIALGAPRAYCPVPRVVGVERHRLSAAGTRFKLWVRHPALPRMLTTFWFRSACSVGPRSRPASDSGWCALSLASMNSRQAELTSS